MNPLFSILSLVYIATIFLLADSPVVSDVAPFNPYSVLHIPLYGILTLLLILSNWSSIFLNKRNPINSRSPIDSKNSTNSMNSINPGNPTNPTNYFIAGIIAFVVAIADEIHQTYIPSRNGSIVDVLLDVVGIGVSILIFLRFGQALIRFLDRTFQQVKLNN